MIDPRFIQEEDVLSKLDQRPNLMDLTPGEFEALITNLFQKMGLDTKLTQASRDGGVDCVAFDPKPIFGGKVVIQAKRYKNTVVVSSVRDLFGTMQNEGASNSPGCLDHPWFFIAVFTGPSITNSVRCRHTHFENTSGFHEGKLMLSIANDIPIYIYTTRVDFRKAVNGLVNLLVESFDQNPHQGRLFVFTNRQRNKLKILFWDKNGFVLYYKRLEKSQFQYSKYLQGDSVVVNPAQLKALLMGLDFYLLGQHSSETCSEFF
jgi:restriction endonuclease Mrr